MGIWPGRKSKSKKDATDEPAAPVDEQGAAIDAAQVSLADDAPDAVTEATEAVEAAAQSETDGTQEIDAKFHGQDFGVEEQLAEMIGQTTGDEDPLATLVGIDSALGDAGRDRLSDFADGLVPDDAQDVGPKYGKDMIADTTTSGHPGAYGIVTDKDGEVTGHYAVAPDDGTLFGIDVAGMAYEKEMNKQADEVHENRGSGGGGGAGGTGSGTPTGGGGSAPASGPTTTTDENGTITTAYSDGTTIVTNPDGTQAVINPDGSVDLYDKDGNHTGHEPPPPKEDPPKDEPPKEDPPKEDPPKEDPPKEDPPKEDPPKADSAESQPDENYIDPETKRLFREQLLKDPQFANYEKQRRNSGDVDPVEDDGTAPVGVALGEAPDMREEGLRMFGQPPPGEDFGSGAGGSSDSGYWNDPNHGAIDPGPDDDVAAGGPQRNDDPFDGVGSTPKPVADEEESETTDDGGGELYLPPSEIAGRVDDPTDEVPDTIDLPT